MSDPFDTAFSLPMEQPEGGNGGLVQDLAIGARATGSGVTLMGARKVEVARRRSDVMNQLKEEANPRWLYSWEVKMKSGAKSVVEGISIKGAMAVMRSYGNCAVATEDVRETDTHLFIKAAFIDVERGFAVSRTWMQSKSQNVGGGIDRERAMMMRFAIGESKAHRSAVEHALEDYCDYAKRMAKSGLIARIENKRDDAVAWIVDGLAKLKVDVAIVEAEFGHKMDKMPTDALARIYTRINTCLDGYVEVKDAFEIKGVVETSEQSAATMDALADKLEKKATPELQDSHQEAGDDIVDTDTGEVTEGAPEPVQAQHGLVHEQTGFDLEEIVIQIDMIKAGRKPTFKNMADARRAMADRLDELVSDGISGAIEQLTERNKAVIAQWDQDSQASWASAINMALDDIAERSAA